MSQDIVERLLSGIGEQFDNELTLSGDEARALHALIATLTAERDALRKTNRDLHRRAQAHESEQAAFLRETGYHEAKRTSDMWSAQWKAEFDRLMRGHQQMKLVYEVCAKVLGLPFGLYHSVMDHKFGAPSSDGKIYANVLLSPQGGGESHEIVATVELLAHRATAAEALVQSMREALEKITTEAEQMASVMEFNSKHMIAEDSLQDAWHMLKMATEQYGVDAGHLRQWIATLSALAQVKP